MKTKKKGAALIVVLAIFAVMAIVGGTVLNLSLSDTKQSVYQVNKTKAYYTAYSGADSMASYIISNPSKVAGIIGKTGTSIIDGNNVSVKVTKNPDDTLLITSTGTVTGASPVNVKLTMNKKSNPVFEYTVFADTFISVGNNTAVYGNLGTNASSINMNGTMIGGTISTNLGIVLSPTDSSYFANDSGNYKLKNGDILKIKTNNVNDIYIKKFVWDSGQPSNAKAQIHIFASNSLTINEIDPPAGITVFLYYNGTDSITESNGKYSLNDVMIYAPFAKFSKNGGGNGDILDGIMIVKECTLPNSHADVKPNVYINVADIIAGQNYARSNWSN